MHYTQDIIRTEADFVLEILLSYGLVGVQQYQKKYKVHSIVQQIISVSEVFSPFSSDKIYSAYIKSLHLISEDKSSYADSMNFIQSHLGYFEYLSENTKSIANDALRDVAKASLDATNIEAYTTLGLFLEAQMLCEQTAQTLMKYQINDSLISVYINWATCLQVSHNDEECQQMLSQAYELLQQNPNMPPINKAYVYYNYARVIMNNDDIYLFVVELLNQALLIFHQSDKHQYETCKVLECLGRIRCRHDNVQKGFNQVYMSLQMQEKLLGIDPEDDASLDGSHWTVIFTYISFAQLNTQINRFELAMRYFHRALTIASLKYGEGSIAYNDVINQFQSCLDIIQSDTNSTTLTM